MFNELVNRASRLKVPSVLECRDLDVSRDVKFFNLLVRTVRSGATSVGIVEYVFPLFGVLLCQIISEYESGRYISLQALCNLLNIISLSIRLPST